jgi:exodeoxyribonuclease VII large subunit
MTDNPPMAELDLPIEHNVAEFSVGEVARAIKRTLEGSFERVRVRGEVSRPNYHGSGHLYFTLKDDEAVIDSVCWRGNVGRLGLTVEEGMEVVCTGRISSYPRSSKYQIVIESIELAGEGALLKLLEDRRKKLTAEGLFDPSQKQELPFLPDIIGVITSPTGAVIRDILHRLADRFPRRVILWPSPVQGEGAAEKIAAAITGFNSCTEDSVIPRPDLLIVARGGGSLEDLWAFNEEVVVRAAAASQIPLISAVGHETDTTLIDFAADVRAPTPTAAAEMAVPVRADLLAQLLDSSRRIVSGLDRYWEDRRMRLEGLGRGLPQPDNLLEEARQRVDGESDRLALAMQNRSIQAVERIEGLGSRLRHPRDIMKAAGEKMAQATKQLTVAWETVLRDRQGRYVGLDAGNRLPVSINRQIGIAGDRLTAQAQLLDSYSYKGVLDRGFALVRNSAGEPVKRAAALSSGDAVEIEFFDEKQRAIIDGGSDSQHVKPKTRPVAKKTSRRNTGDDDEQGSLL